MTVKRTDGGRSAALAATCATLVLLLLLIAGPAAARKPASLSCARIPELSRTYLHKHISFHYLNEELRERVIDTYIRRLDPSKSMLLLSDVQSLQQRLQGILQDVRDGNCSLLTAIHKEMVKRYARMQEFTRKLLEDESYALDTNAVLIIDPEKRSHSRTAEARDELATRLVHFQISNYLSSEMALAEAKQKLIHRYELMTKRVEEQSEEDIYASYLDAFASALDPHSNYLSRDVHEDFKIGMELSLDGIGVALSSRDGYSVVEKVIPGGAADSLDILEPKDKIIAVAQADETPVDIIDMDLRDVVRLIRGKRGTKVHLTVLRQSEVTERFRVTIVRDKINLEEQAAKLRIEQVEIKGEPIKLAILELPSFYGGRDPGERQSSRDIQQLLKQVDAEGAAGLLLDLSRNGGGLLENSVDIAGFFIERGGVVAVKDAYSKIQVLSDRDSSIVYDGPMVVLTSRVSASASEIVAGALKDYRRAVIVGDDHTFGKGTVQSMVPLTGDLGALKVTTALFFRPGGKSTQHAGVSADVEIPSVFATDEFGEKYQDYSLPSQSIVPFLSEKNMTEAKGRSEKAHWPVVTSDIVAELKQRSAKRVAESKEFSEIRERKAKAEERNGVVHLADLLKEKEEEAAKNGGAVEETAATDSDPKEPSPQQLEGLRILADLVSLTS